MQYEELHPELQAVVAKIADHLGTQRRQARSDGHCQYRAEDGCMCAIGVLIPDDLYRAGLEGSSLEDLTTRSGFMDVAEHLYGLAPNVQREAIDLVLGVAQAYHDGNGVLSYAKDLVYLRDLDNEALAYVIRQHICMGIRTLSYKEAA